MGVAMESVYTYFDYEQAYFHGQYYKCKTIGLYLLSKIKNKKAEELYKRLLNFEYDWLHPTHEDDTLLNEIKIWLMVYEYCIIK